MSYSTTPNGYGKRPLWQWLLIYLVIGGVIYAAIYYFFLSKNGNSYTYPAQTSATPAYTTPTTTVSPAPLASSTPQSTPTTAAQSSELLMTKTDPTKGSYLVATNGMTLYVFDKDTKNVSNCNGGCLQVWPAYMPTDPSARLPANLTIFKRADGTSQYAYKGHPIYFYSPDQKPGDTLGDGVGGTWHLVKP